MRGDAPASCGAGCQPSGAAHAAAALTRRTHALAQVSNLIGHNTNLATGLEHEAGECVCRIVRALHPDGSVQRVREKLYVPWEGKLLEIDEVVLAVDRACAYIVEAENVLSESSGDELQKRLE
jgi:hypothetical protein